MNTATQQAPQRRITIIPADPQLTEKDIRKKHLRVAPYCRVSTDSEEQLNSYNAQIAYYTEKIAATPEWTMVRLYADEGITGITVQDSLIFTKANHHWVRVKSYYASERRVLRVSDLVAWRLKNSAYRPVKGVEPAMGAVLTQNIP